MFACKHEKCKVRFVRLISAAFSLQIFQANKIRNYNINMFFFISGLCPNIDLCIDSGTSTACNFIKKVTPTQVFSCEFYEIFKNIFFYRTPSGLHFGSHQRPYFYTLLPFNTRYRNVLFQVFFSYTFFSQIFKPEILYFLHKFLVDL